MFFILCLFEKPEAFSATTKQLISHGVINKEYVFTPERLGQLTCLFIYKVSHGKQASINSALKYSTPPSVFSDLGLWVN